MSKLFKLLTNKASFYCGCDYCRQGPNGTKAYCYCSDKDHC